jgi:uncharacterized membrane protein YjjB (DUF3815 family)
MQERPTARPGKVAGTSSGRTTTLLLAATSFILELATLLALLLDNCSLATILAALAVLFGGATAYRVMSATSGDQPDPVYHDPPPK